MSRKIQGFCVEPHKCNVGLSQEEKIFTEDELREAAPTLASKYIYETNQYTMENIIGEVTYSEYIEGKGVRYEAEIKEPDMAEQIESGRVTPVPVMTHRSIDTEEETPPYKPTEITFDGLFLSPEPTEGVPDLGRPGVQNGL